MLVVTKKGTFLLESNYRDAFVLDTFESKYIEECFDRYLYLVGDLSSGILRLKGFDDQPQSKNYYGQIRRYLETSCALGCPYYVLKRLKTEKEIEEETQKNTEVRSEGFSITALSKESFDKENLVLQSSLKQNPKIIIDPEKINAIPKGSLSSDLKETTTVTPTASEEVTTTYVSSSPGFVLNQNHQNKQNNYRHNKNRKKKK